MFELSPTELWAPTAAAAFINMMRFAFKKNCSPHSGPPALFYVLSGGNFDCDAIQSVAPYMEMCELGGIDYTPNGISGCQCRGSTNGHDDSLIINQDVPGDAASGTPALPRLSDRSHVPEQCHPGAEVSCLPAVLIQIIISNTKNHHCEYKTVAG